MGKLRSANLPALPFRLADRIFIEPFRRRRYLRAEREFMVNCDRMVWLLAKAYVGALSAAENSILLPDKKIAASFLKLFEQQETLLETMLKNLSSRMETDCWICLAQYDRLARVLEFFTTSD